MTGGPVLTARGLERSYVLGGGLFRSAATLQALRGVSFELFAGRTLAVVGESGCGKSTLARLVTLIEPPSAGDLVVDGVDVVKGPRSKRTRLRKEVQIVFQDSCIHLIAADGLTAKRRAAARIELPFATASTIRRRRSSEIGAGMTPHLDRLNQYCRITCVDSTQ